MKYLKRYEEYFEVDYYLDKINKSGYNSLTEVEKNQLNQISVDNKDIEDVIRLLSQLSQKCKIYMDAMRDNQDQSFEANKKYMDLWTKASREMTRYENILKNSYGLEITDYKLNNEEVNYGKVNPDDEYDIDVVTRDRIHKYENLDGVTYELSRGGDDRIVYIEEVENTPENLFYPDQSFYG